ncbi:MAG: multicopper oxidase domain-containing protein [Flavobacteriales bacterium]|jgi:FtsP/CotA-like multicopper oxidase with cupredoxin domain|nr:multicopper oxidase domain-containing protein [Flavobacteriales bacterium]
MKQLTILLLLLLSYFTTYSQIDVSKLLISKIDVFKHFTLPDGNKIKLMGYTELIGSLIDLPAPTLIFNEGNSVRLDLWNLSQGPPHTIHLHGLDVNQQNDGVPMTSYSIAHDDTASYYFKAPHPGTYLYHCHVVSPIHVQAGMYGLIIVKPANGSNTTWDNGYSYDNEAAFLLSEIDTTWHHDTILNHTMEDKSTPLTYIPQYFLINGNASFGGTAVNYHANETTYLRFANIGNLGNQIVLPEALNAQIISSDGRPLPNPEANDTIIVLPGERYGVLIEPITEFQNVIQIEYFNLNTENNIGQQTIPVNIEGFSDHNENETILSKIKTYPVPSNGLCSLEFEINQTQNINIQVMNLLGKPILNKRYTAKVGLNQTSINLSNQASGVYWIKILLNQKIYTQTLILK